MEWKTLTGITEEIEINHLGIVRYKDDKSIIMANFSRVTGYYEVNLVFGREGGGYRTTKRNVHILVAMYFLNNGEPIDKRKKVVFKDFDTSNYIASNLEIVDRYGERQAPPPRELKTPKPKEPVFINYGDEIYC